MPEQFALAGFEAAPRPTDRLFFAVFPEQAVRVEQLAERLRSEHGLRGKPLATDRFHVTLNHLGDYTGLPADVIAMAKNAAASIAMPRFEVTFDRVASFTRGKTRNQPFVLRGGDGLAALITFQRTLATAMKQVGLGRWVEAQFTPHMTLLYDERGIEEQLVETIDWTVREFVLVHSLIGRTMHVPLARWPLFD